MPTLINISPELIKAYREEISKTSSAATVKRKTISLNKFFNWAETEGHIEKNPLTITPPPAKKPHKSYILNPKSLAIAGMTFGMAILVFAFVWKARSPIQFIRDLANNNIPESKIQTIPGKTPQSTPTPTLIPAIPTEIPSGSPTPSAGNPAIGGANVLIEGETVTIKTTDGGDGNIEINPDGGGIAHFLFEGTGENFLNAQAPNLTSGSLYYGLVANNATGYDLLRLQSGSKPITRLSIDALGNTFIGGSATIAGNFTITQSPGNFASISKKGSALSDVLSLTLDERSYPNSSYSTLVLNRYNGAKEALALLVDEGNARFDSQLQLGRFSSNPDSIGQGSIVFNTTDSAAYVWNGSSWVAFAGSGANADTLDLLDSTQFLRSDTSDNFTSGTLTFDAGTTLNVNGTISLPNNAVVPNNVLSTSQTDEFCLTYESTGGTWEWQGCAGAGAMNSFTVAGDSGGGQTISDGNTLSILGGTNGIDTADSVTDTVTLNLDTTEIGSTTFGSGSGITWTFDASAGTDTSITFGNNTITFTGTLSGNGSGLTSVNADTLDSLDSLQFLRSDTSDNFTSGTLTTDAGTTLDVNGDVAIADTNIAFDGATTTFTTTGDLTIDSGGGQVLFADADTLNIGGKTGLTYNAFADAADAPEEAAIAADNDLYVGGDVEIDGTLYAASVTATALAWDDITSPTDNLTLTMAAYNTVFNWDPGDNSAETAFSLTFDGQDTAADEDQVLIALSQIANATDSTEAADALLTFANSDSNDPVENAIRFDAGAAGTDFTYGINFDAASIGTAEIVLQNAETIDNTVDGTIALSGDLAITGGNITTAVTADSTLTVTGTLTANGTLDANGIVTLGDGGDSVEISGSTVILDIAGTDELTLSATALYPTTTDGNALGSTTNMWSDLFLASGGVINFDNGDVTLTHAANLLSLGGGNLDVSTNTILNIGSVDTDFSATGGLTLADILTVNDDIDVNLAAGENIAIADSAATTVDAISLILDAGTVTDTVDGIYIDFRTGNPTGASTNTGINLDLTSGGDAANEVLIGLDLTLTGTSGTERGINFGDNNFDTDINATTDLTLGIGGTNEITLTATALSPTTTDGNALGTASLMWSDLFLASGGVINFDNGDVTLTHAANALDIAGGDFNIGIIDGATINLDGDGSPTADILQIGSGDNSATAGVDALQITFDSTNASGNAIDVALNGIDGDGTDTTIAIDINAFTYTSSAGTNIVQGLSLGNLTEAGAGVTTSTAINVGSGWDSVLKVNGTEVISSTGTIPVAQISGTLFTAAGDSGGGQAITQGNTLTIAGGTNITSVDSATDTVTINLDDSITLAGDIAVNGDDITSDGNLTINATGYVRVGDTGTPITATDDDDDLYVQGDLETGGNIYLTGHNIYNVISGSGTGTIVLATDPTGPGVAGDYNTLTYGAWLVQNATNNGMAALMVDQTKGGDIFTASASGTPKFVIDNSGNVGIGDTTPDYDLELYQADSSTANPNFALSNGDIGHGVTTLAQTDTFGLLSILDTTSFPSTGGLEVTGFADASAIALQLKGVQSSNPTDTLPAISLIGTKASGTGVQDLAAAETVLQIANNDNAAALTVLGNGKVGIGDTTPAALFTVGSGDLFQVGSTGAITFNNTSITADITLQNGETIDNNTDGYIDITGYLSMGTGTGALKWDIFTGGSLTECESGGGSINAMCWNDKGDVGSEMRLSASGAFVTAGSQTPSSDPDYAEMIEVIDQTIEPGDIVSVTQPINSLSGVNLNNQRADKSQFPYDQKVIGIISQDPGVLIAPEGRSMKIDEETRWKDETRRALSVSGRVMAKVSAINGQIRVGDLITTSHIPGVGMKATQAGNIIGKAMEPYDNADPQAVGKIAVFINLSWYDPGVFATTSTEENIIDRIGAFAEMVAANIKAGAAEIDKLIAKSVETNLISPIPGENLAVGLAENSKFEIRNSDEDKTVAEIDNQGNATFSGELTAREIHSENLDEIDALLTQVATDQSVLLAATASAGLSATESTALSELITSDLYVTTHAAISSLLVNEDLTVENINSLSEPLRIQSLAAAPIEIMAGLVKIDTQGNVQIAGNLDVAGKITAPEAELKNLTIEKLLIASSADTSEVSSGSSEVVSGNITTNSTVGKGIIPAGVDAITITNPKVGNYTLIYITPTSSTQNRVLYVKAKDTGWFSVGFTEALETDVVFNWWIVETQ